MARWSSGLSCTALEELSPGMCPAAHMHHLRATHTAVGRIAVSLQYAFESCPGTVSVLPGPDRLESQTPPNLPETATSPPPQFQRTRRNSLKRTKVKELI